MFLPVEVLIDHYLRYGIPGIIILASDHRAFGLFRLNRMRRQFERRGFAVD